MKIDIVLQSYNGGGAEKIALVLAEEWKRDGHNVGLVVLFPRGPYKNYLPDGIRLTELKVSRECECLPNLWRHVKKQAPDVLISAFRATHIWVAIAGLASTKTFIAFREASIYRVARRQSLKDRIALVFLRFAYHRADRIIANSIDTKRVLVKNFAFVDTKTEVINNPIKFSEPSSQSLKNICQLQLEDPRLKTITSMGRLHPQKNYSFLIRAFARAVRDLPNIRLVIIGAGDEYSKLLALSESLGVKEKVHFTGFIDHPEQLLETSDLYIQTSVYEGFGNALVEAMGKGVPVIAIDCPGGPKEITEGGALGHLLADGDEESLADKIIEFFSGELRINPPSKRYIHDKYNARKIARRYLLFLKK